MASTYTPIATNTLGSAASSVTFSSIPTTYTDLRLVITGGTTLAGEKPSIRFNSDSGTNYSYAILYGDGSSTGSTSGSNQSYLNPSWAGSMSNTIPTFYTIDIFSYSNSSVYKTILCTFSGDKNGSGDSANVVNLWRSTSAINNIYIYASGGSTFTSGSTFTLYGIKAA